MGDASDIRVALIRSGATDWDRAGRLGGCCELPICEQGLVDLRSALSAIPSGTFALVLTAPDQTSRASARLVSDRCGGRVRAVRDLAEMDFGLWEGMLASEVEEKFPTAFRLWQEDAASVAAPEGETLPEARDRIIAGLRGALSRVKDETRPVAVVLRPAAMSIVSAWLEGDPGPRFWPGDGSRTEAVRWARVARDASAIASGPAWR